MVSIVSAVRSPQRWPGDSGVGGALVQSHPCRAPVEGDKDALRIYTSWCATDGKDELCVCVCVCVYMAHPHPPTEHTTPHTCMACSRFPVDVLKQ